MGTYRNRELICTSEITIGLISGKWKPLILGFLSENPTVLTSFKN